MSLDTIALVTISLQPPPISLAGFGTALTAAILTVDQGNSWDSIYGSGVKVITLTPQDFKAALTALGVTSTEQLHRSLTAEVSQDKVPARMKVGRRGTTTAQVSQFNIDAAEDGDYTVTVNGTPFVHTSSSETATQIKDALITLVDAAPEVSSVTVDTDSASVTAVEAGVTFSISVTHSATPANISVELTTPSVGITEDIQIWETEDSDWYELIESTRSSGVIKDASADIESRIKIFQGQTDDAVAQTSGTTDIGSVLKGLALDRTGLWFHNDDTEHSEAAISGFMLPQDPGSATWAGNTIKGVTGITLTGESFLADKNYNWNENFAAAGFTMTRTGKMASGQFIDIIRGRDFLQNLIQTRLVDAIRKEPKIPYTDRGGDMIGTVIRTALVEAAGNGLIVEDSIVVTIPAVATQSSTSKGNRDFPNVTFSATLQGAIHSIVVNGSLET